MRVLVGALLVVCFSCSLLGVANAGTLTAAGAVKALDDRAQIRGVVGTANFDEGPTTGLLPTGTYADRGLTWRTGPLRTILPGCVNDGTAHPPSYGTFAYFPDPIAGGGMHNGQSILYGGVVTFSVPVTQVGLTASTNGTQHLTAWDRSGAMIGQVTWAPAEDSAFVGIDTLGVPIAMIAYGNQDVWAGQDYEVGGATIISDSWIWATGMCPSSSRDSRGKPCADDGKAAHPPGALKAPRSLPAPRLPPPAPRDSTAGSRAAMAPRTPVPRVSVAPRRSAPARAPAPPAELAYASVLPTPRPSVTEASGGCGCGAPGSVREGVLAATPLLVLTLRRRRRAPRAGR